MSTHEVLEVGREGVLAHLPHRPPFLLIDGVTAISLGSSIEAVRAIDPGDPVFDGHFPGWPIYPGALVAEAMAQAMVLLLNLSGRLVHLLVQQRGNA